MKKDDAKFLACVCGALLTIIACFVLQSFVPAILTVLGVFLYAIDNLLGHPVYNALAVKFGLPHE